MTALDRGPEARQRAEAYRFLASLFARRLEGEVLNDFIALAAESPEDGDSAADAILGALRGETAGEALALRLATEHTRLFRGVREEYGPPPPYESLWREGQLMGDCTVAVAGQYLDAGFQHDPAWGPLDHIVEELRFMAALCHAEDDAWGTGRADEAAEMRQRQEAFLQAHLAAWVPAYCHRLEQDAREPLYLALAQVVARVVTEDALMGGNGSVGG
jgi:TorA maturation chaperone TorD